MVVKTTAWSSVSTFASNIVTGMAGASLAPVVRAASTGEGCSVVSAKPSLFDKVADKVTSTLGKAAALFSATPAVALASEADKGFDPFMSLIGFYLDHQLQAGLLFLAAAHSVPLLIMAGNFVAEGAMELREIERAASRTLTPEEKSTLRVKIEEFSRTHMQDLMYTIKVPGINNIYGNFERRLSAVLEKLAA